MKLTIDPFDTASIDGAIKVVDKYSTDLQKNLKEVCRRLAIIGRDTAQFYYDTFTSTQDYYQGEIDINVVVESIENGYAVHATGNSPEVAENAVLFIEFGTGVYFNSPRDYPGEVPPEVLDIGTYGKGRGKRNAWGFYNGAGELVITRGNPPEPAMYYAQQEMIRRANEVIKEVFKT